MNENSFDIETVGFELSEARQNWQKNSKAVLNQVRVQTMVPFRQIEIVKTALNQKNKIITNKFRSVKVP